MRLSTKYPFNISSLGLAVEIFRRIMEKELGIIVSDKEVWISCIEFNKDYPNLKLEGVNCITWDEMIYQFKLYNKSKGLREEYRIKIPFNYEWMNKLFNNSFATAESNALMERQDKIIDSMMKLFKKMNMKLNWLCDNFHKDNKMKVEKSSLF